MPTDLDMVNQALNEAGQDRVTSLDNTVNSKVIQTANFQLPRVKRAVLRMRDWGCARKRTTVNALDENLSLGEWSQAYRLPHDFLAFRKFISECAEVAHAPRSVEIDNQNKKILYTNCGNNKIVYTADLLDVNRWDALLYDACATRLSIEFAITFNKDARYVGLLRDKLNFKLEEAMGVDEAESGVEFVYEPDLINVRF